VSTDIREDVIAAIEQVAPDVDGHALDPSEDILDACDLDSMDMLNMVAALHERLGVEIPERDYPRLRTVDGAVAYLQAHGEPAAG
jgi:acyl carrier protein